MNEKFFDLAREKQDRMINGAIEVFAKNGYRHASTDDMVKVAGISKGLWFHYFGSKEGLYVFVYDYCVKYMLLELSTVVDGNKNNFFERMKQIALTKTKVYKSYPYLVLFLDEAAHEEEESVRVKTAESRKNYNARIESLINTAEIPGMPDKSMRTRIEKLLGYSINGTIREKTLEGASADVMYKEIHAYIELMQKFVQGLQ